LLATQSLGIVKIQQDGFIGLPGGFLGLGQIVQPANLYCHGFLLIIIILGRVLWSVPAEKFIAAGLLKKIIIGATKARQS
jgi:hypothetical protein